MSGLHHIQPFEESLTDGSTDRTGLYWRWESEIVDRGPRPGIDVDREQLEIRRCRREIKRRRHARGRRRRKFPLQRRLLRFQQQAVALARRDGSRRSVMSAGVSMISSGF
jgi:hypothetical protein